MKEKWAKKWNWGKPEKCGLPKDKRENMFYCFLFEAIERMKEELKRAKDCNQNEIEIQYSAKLETLKLKFPEGYHSDDCSRVFDSGGLHESNGNFSSKPIPCALYLMVSLFIAL